MKTGNTTRRRGILPRQLQPQWSPVMKTGNTAGLHRVSERLEVASMEPGHEDREYPAPTSYVRLRPEPQWSPVMKTGNTPGELRAQLPNEMPQWSPVMKTGNTVQPLDPLIEITQPQWSPVMKTGNTACTAAARTAADEASMEPGHEDREYSPASAAKPDSRERPQWSPVMKTGNTRRVDKP